MNSINQPKFKVVDVAKVLKNAIIPSDLILLQNEETNYISNISNPISIAQNHNIGTLKSIQLKDLYNKDFSVHVKPRLYYKQIVESSRFCPYCGIDNPCEVDHFLPKSTYESLSIVPANLTPICSICNKKKTEKSPKGATAFFIHPYFDSIVNWLKFDISFRGKNPIFKLKPINSTIQNSAKIMFTLQELDLYTRIENQAISCYNDKKHIFAKLKQDGMKKFDEYLNLVYDIKKINHIENAVIECLINNEAIVFSNL